MFGNFIQGSIKKVKNIYVLCGGTKDNDKKMKFITKII